MFVIRGVKEVGLLEAWVSRVFCLCTRYKKETAGKKSRYCEITLSVSLRDIFQHNNLVVSLLKCSKYR